MKRYLTIMVCGAFACFGPISSVYGQTYEDEWYDPTDWFDANNYEYDDTLGLDTSYGTDYSDGEFGDYDDYAATDYGWGSYNNLGYDADYDSYDWGIDEPAGAGTDTEWGYDEGWGTDWDTDWGFNDEYGDDWGYGEDGWGYNYDTDWQADTGFYPASLRPITQQSGSGYSDSGSQSRNTRQSQSRSQSQYSQQQPRSQTQARGQRQSQAKSGRTTIRGEVQNWQVLDLKNRQGLAEKHTVVELGLQDGKNVLVDLGRVGTPATRALLELNRGDQIAVAGNIGTINNRNVLMAKTVQLDGKTYHVGQQAMAGQPKQFGAMQLDGRVEAVRRVKMPGTGDQHTHVKVRLENGRSAIVDLGKNVSLSKLQIQPQEKVTISGQRKVVNGTPVLSAQKIWVNGQPKQLQQREG